MYHHNFLQQDKSQKHFYAMFSFSALLANKEKQNEAIRNNMNANKPSAC